jgi:uncharacterized protein with PQ loop repeat
VHLIELAALIATTVAVFGALPQLRSLARTGDASGVSLASATLGVTSELGWLSYTLHGALWSAVPESILMVSTNALLARAIVRTDVALARAVLVAVVWAATLVTCTLLGGWALLGLLLPVAYTVQVAPAVWSAYRTHSPSGIAASTWGLILIESVLWGCYGLARDDPALQTFAIVGSVASSAILLRLLATRRRRRAGLELAVRPVDDLLADAEERVLVHVFVDLRAGTVHFI